MLALALLCLDSISRGEGDTGGGGKPPRIEDYATIESWCDGVPVYAFGYTYVYGISPDLLPGAQLQEGNTNPLVKVKPKKSWEIKHNLCGSTPAREPKTMWNDDQPLLPVHLIDGDPETAWSSRGATAADGQPEWIRIDLPAESTVASVAMVLSKVGPSVEGKLQAGKALPKDVTVKLSRDAKRWETVYANASFSGSDSGPTEIQFAPRPAKQVWLIATGLSTRLQWGHAFSIGEIQVRDSTGNNLALLSRGAGVQVSSTYYGYGMDRFTQDMLWPIQYDIGFKWTRVGYDMGMYLWSYVEREKGKLQIDRRADEVITEAARNGVSVILCLDKGNWLYREPPKKLDWKKARVFEMMETYYDHQGWPTDSGEMMEGWLRYVDYMVRHFKGRVAYYEIGNEWQKIGIDNYVRLVKATIPVIKKADPGAKVMLGSVSGFDRDAMLACLGDRSKGSEIEDGKLAVSNPTIAVVEQLRDKDLTVTVEARHDAEAGLVLRLKDSGNFLLANYAPQHNSIYFHEVVNNDYGQFLATTSIKDLAPKIQLTAELDDSQITFTVSDGTKTVSTSHSIQHATEGGGVGVFHNEAPRQTFDNFKASNKDGSALFEDRFDRPPGPAPGWRHVVGHWKVEEGLAPLVDAIGWHPWYQTDPDQPAYRRYQDDVQQFRRDCAALGFDGQFAATEWTWAAPYPGTAESSSEMQKAKYSAQLMTAHCAMDVISLYNETFQTGKIDWDCNLLRNAFQVDPISAAQPQPIYYMLRTISTVMDGFRASNFSVQFSSKKHFDCYTLKRGDNELMIAAWIPGRTKDGVVEERSDVTLPAVRASRAWAVDAINGTEQELVITHQGDDTVLQRMLIKDYPIFMRVLR